MKIQELKGYFAVLGIMAASYSASAQVPTKLIDPANMDLSVKPGDDFYQYASGTWIKNNPVPAKETRWGSFNVLRDFNINAVKGLVEEAAADKAAPAGSLKRRVGDFYTAAMDSATIEKLGYTPIKADLARVANIKDLKGIINEVIYMRTAGIGSPIFGFYVDQDEKNVTSSSSISEPR
ncbi:hypothetical protein [Pedobacter sp.]|uniref:hypothetical protein n=1 Tax=Pedobacter sp. TaxID=1411316 RepID=UPI003D7FE4A1